MVEQENHNLCVRGSNPFAAITNMYRIAAYYLKYAGFKVWIGEALRNNRKCDGVV